MKLYITSLIKVDHMDRIFRFKGPNIIAEDYEHALLALAHHNLANYSLIAAIPFNIDDISKPVQWDSLLYPSELQLN